MVGFKFEVYIRIFQHTSCTNSNVVPVYCTTCSYMYIIFSALLLFKVSRPVTVGHKPNTLCLIFHNLQIDYSQKQTKQNHAV